MTEAELLPCPFCGGKAERLTLDEPGNEGGDVIVCTRCQCSSHVEFNYKENLVSRWNTRAKPTPVSGTDAVEVTQARFVTGSLVGDLRACSTGNDMYAAAADEIERQAADLRTYSKTMDMINKIEWADRVEADTARLLSESFTNGRLAGLEEARTKTPEWRCVNCKTVTAGHLKPDRCPECNWCVGFAEVAAIRAKPTPVSGTDAVEVTHKPYGGASRKFVNSVGNEIQIHVEIGASEATFCRLTMIGPHSEFENYTTWDELVQLHSALSEALGIQSLSRTEELVKAARNLKPYLEWTCGPESPGCHPTMPSAVGAFLAALASHRGEGPTIAVDDPANTG